MAVHKITAICQDEHCLSHQDDEPGYAFEECPACGHRYRTASELRSISRREAFRWARATKAGLRARWWLLWLTVVSPRAARIDECRYCDEPLTGAPAGSVAGVAIPAQTSGPLEGEVIPAHAKQIQGWIKQLRNEES